MAKSHDPFLLVLARIRDRVQAGAYAAGRPIVIVEEARRLRVSTTPVREALACLCGEGLVERGPSGGFVAVDQDAAAVRDRYGLRLICLLAAMDLTRGLPTFGRAPDRGAAPLEELRDLFDGLVRRSGNAALARAHDRVVGQLRRLDAAADRIFPDAADEADRLLTLAATDRNGDLRDALALYHARRAGAAAILALEASRPAGADDEGRTP